MTEGRNRCRAPSLVFFATILSLALLFALSCDRGHFTPDSDQDPILNEPGDGPMVIFEPLADPIPLLPFPNDILTKPESDNPTGLRLNVPTDASTEFERTLRRRINRMDGFGPASPVTVSFSDPLNIETIDPGTVMVFNIDEGSPEYGQRVVHDLVQNSYPMVMQKPTVLFPYDEYNDEMDMVFRPGNRQTYYEDESDTLILKPLVPMLPATEYAVILTKDLLGEDGEPVQAPEDFEYIYFPQQQESALKAVEFADETWGIDPEDIAFVWTFTTQTVAADLETIRNGLDGTGVLARLRDEFPRRVLQIDHLSVETDGDQNPYIMSAAALQGAFDFLLSWTEDMPGVPIDFPYSYWSDMQYIDYFTAGVFETPNFLGSSDGIFTLDRNTGYADYGREQVPFLIAVPKPCEANGWAEPPYPIVLFQHGNERNRDDMVLVSNAWAKYGYATISMDAAGHGPETVVGYIDHYLKLGLADPDGPYGKLAGMLMTWWLNQFYPSVETQGKSLQELYDIVMDWTLIGAMNKGRARDTDGDGIPNSGDDFFTADAFLTRDMVRQTVVDQMLFVRIAKQFGQDTNGNGELDLEEGDFNLDGVPDLGGPDLPIHYVGTSMGGILGSVFMAVDNEVQTGVVNVPGGMLTDLVVRSSLASVATRVFYEILGPRIVGTPDPLDPENTLMVWNHELFLESFDSITLVPGWTIVLFNENNHERDQFVVTEDLGFQVGVPCDVGDPLTLFVYDGEELIERREYTAKYRGIALERNTTEFRNFLGFAQMCVDAGDPVNYAPLWNSRPLEGNPPKNVLVQLSLGDYTVPAATGVAVGRSAGLVSPERNLHLVRLGVMLGWDKYTPFEALNEPFESISGSGFRIHPAGNHAYIYWPTAWAPDQMRWTFAVKEQIGIYLQSNGEVIEDDMNVLLEDYPDL